MKKMPQPIPYQGSKRNIAGAILQYSSGVVLPDLVSYVEQLNDREVMFALSYDGIKGGKTHGEELPHHLRLHRIWLNAGRSTQSTLLGKSAVTFESLYLSEALAARLRSESPKFNANGLRQTAIPSSSPRPCISADSLTDLKGHWGARLRRFAHDPGTIVNQLLG
jgi:hypothetical protein